MQEYGHLVETVRLRNVVAAGERMEKALGFESRDGDAPRGVGITGIVSRVLGAFLFASGVMLVILATLLLLAVRDADAAEVPSIDMTCIAEIESSHDPRAWNRSDDSRGLYQITRIALEDYNQYHLSRPYRMDDLWDAEVNETIARWMFERRLPQMIRHYKKPLTVRNLIISYNAGIGYVKSGRPIPSITHRYIEKYEECSK